MKLKNLPESWDLIVIGGGITGAGIFREAARMGLKTLLLERRDFSWGTSSRSTKLVHGGLRYLREGHIFVTKAAVEERERMLKEAPGLVEHIGFLMPVYKGSGPGKWTVDIGLLIYDLLARQKQHDFFDREDFTKMSPLIKTEDLAGGFIFYDAQVDDARMVLRLINEAIQQGASAINYTEVTEIKRGRRGEVVGVVARDTEKEIERTFISRAVINATGTWGEELHPSPDPKRHLRPLRGSHLVFSSTSLPLDKAVAFMHPDDNRGFFAIPWEGAVIVGTTDVDHKEDLAKEPVISEDEVSYIMRGLKAYFPTVDITAEDCISTYAGIRPVLSEGKLSPSEESRDYVVWKNKGLVTVTGGKLTTFRRMAWDTLKAAKAYLPSVEELDKGDPVFSKVPEKPDNDYGLPPEEWRRLYGRYGEGADELVSSASKEDLTHVPGTHTLWAEIPFVAKREQVRHLSDLLLRRVRIGMLTPKGGREHLERIKNLCKSSLPWTEVRWEEEIDMYNGTWERAYSLPSKKGEENNEHERPDTGDR
jgi:glycerol-3-phosphate dehydrogenase